MAPALRAKKSLGQHFLRDRGVLEKILHAADLSADDRVLEIGAGAATLTTPLSRDSGHLTALETDHRRVPRLRELFPAGGNVDIVDADILQFDLETLAPNEESEKEFTAMRGWVKNIWADTLGLPMNYRFSNKV